jgi:hypothetical protein
MRWDDLPLPTHRARAGHRALRELGVLAGLLVLGALSGALAKAADESPYRWAADLGTYPAAWVLALALVARLSPTMPLAAVRASVFFLSMSLAYFAWSSVVLGFGVERYALLWLALAVSAVPVGASVSHWACNRRGALPGLVLAAVAALAVADRLAWQLWWAWVLDDAPDDFPLRPFQAFFGIAVALVITAVLPRHHRTRRYAVLCLLSVAILIAGLIDRVLGTLLRFV